MAEGERFYGRYRAKIIDRDDPQGRGRVRLLIPAVLGPEISLWAERVFTDAGTDLPAADDIPIAEFLEGDVGHPLWTGWLRGSPAAAGPADGTA